MHGPGRPGNEHERRTSYAKARALLDGVLVADQQATEAREFRHCGPSPETS
ncbi:hypothetical protein [Streptomyces sp. NPDC056707]|uniref:hypothetical protein n=1 Tax=Streptomyces sp. NPDC056707 TaxID=3345919 RepID=UPI00368C63A5